jgi:ComF family protein
MFKNIINLFFPKVCAGCNSFLLTNEKVICTVCRHEIPLTNHHLKLDNENFNRFYGRIPLESAQALFYFHKKGIVQELIHNLKFRGHQEIGTEIGNWYSEDLQSLEIIKTIDEIIPVPVHKKRFKERGYNQVTTFGEALSKNLNIDYNPNILVRNVYSKTQSKKNLLDRNVTNANIFDVNFTEKDHNKHFMLIDDVMTTGATLELCANALLKIPGTKISIVTMAMAHS